MGLTSMGQVCFCRINAENIESTIYHTMKIGKHVQILA